MIDSHCHLDDPRIQSQRKVIIERAKKSGVKGFLIAGVDPEKTGKEVAGEIPDCAFAVGLHPWIAGELDQNQIEKKLHLIKSQIGEASALGEIGIDLRRFGPETLERQKEAFRGALAIAREAKKPVILHVVSAHSEVLEILKRDQLPKEGGVLHSCSASKELCELYLKLGLFISFSGSLTNPKAKKIQKAFLSVPLERILFETDSPDQFFSGRSFPNEPAFLGEILSFAASLRGISFSFLEELSERNFFSLFPCP